jgi:hypothetical protein
MRDPVIPFDCLCGTQLECRVVIERHAAPCPGGCTVESGCPSEPASWHAEGPVTCEDCGRAFTMGVLDADVTARDLDEQRADRPRRRVA